VLVQHAPLISSGRRTLGRDLPGQRVSSTRHRKRRSSPTFERLRSVPGRKDKADYQGGFGGVDKIGGRNFKGHSGLLSPCGALAAVAIDSETRVFGVSDLVRLLTRSCLLKGNDARDCSAQHLSRSARGQRQPKADALFRNLTSWLRQNEPQEPID
jgi:hypothetical protein